MICVRTEQFLSWINCWRVHSLGFVSLTHTEQQTRCGERCGRSCCRDRRGYITLNILVSQTKDPTHGMVSLQQWNEITCCYLFDRTWLRTVFAVVSPDLCSLSILPFHLFSNKMSEFIECFKFFKWKYIIIILELHIEKTKIYYSRR